MNPFPLYRDHHALLYEEDGLAIGRVYTITSLRGTPVLKTKFLCFPGIYEGFGRGYSFRTTTRLGRLIKWIN